MWWYLTPILSIFYIGMAFVSGPIYIRATQDNGLDEGDDTFIGYTIAAVFWPVCLTVCGLFVGARATGVLWMKYANFLETYYKKTHAVKPRNRREYY